MTTKRLASIAVMSASTHAAIFSFLLAYPLVALIAFFKHFDPERTHVAQSPWWMAWVLVPIGLALVGIVVTMLFCMAYNVSARLLGGVRYTVEETMDGVRELGG
jgi:membrane protein YqaA with SNARE-associated domain